MIERQLQGDASIVSTFFSGYSTYNFNNMNPIPMLAGKSYLINLELWGTNTLSTNSNVSRDFALIALSDGGSQVTFTHM